MVADVDYVVKGEVLVVGIVLGLIRIKMITLEVGSFSFSPL